MFCKNCGKELPDESQFCPYCMTRFVKTKEIQPLTETAKPKKKKLWIPIVAAVLCVAIIVSAVVIVPRLRTKQTNTSAGSADAPAGAMAGTTKESETKTLNKDPSEPKSAEEDDGLGLMNIKIDGTHNDLSETEQLLVEYFDKDYFYLSGGTEMTGADPYDLLQRYPDAYENAQIEFACVVRKIIKVDSTNYTVLVEFGAQKVYPDGMNADVISTGDYAVLKGKHGEERLIVDDGLYIYGRYEGIETYTVDGKSYTVPTIATIRYTYNADFHMSPLYSMEDIRTIAKYVFGNNIKLRGITEDDYPPEDVPEWIYDGEDYVCEPDNQSNANFTKYQIRASWGGGIYDLKSNWPVERRLTFSADFEHFYLSVFDHQLETYILESYDRDLKKEWSREFDKTTSSVMDYIKDHIYLVANGSMYILDTKTGEDAVSPKYVGAKIGIRKLTDGILLIAQSKSDAVMKTDLVGNVLWTVNLNNDIFYQEPEEDTPIVQLVNQKYVMQYKGVKGKDAYGGQITVTCIAVLNPDGSVKMDKQMMA